jgi:L-asparaginase/Glu-tRNA(Gln) amidotransferase subunit D
LKTEVHPEFPSTLFQDEFLSGLDSILLTLYPSATAPTESEGFPDFLLRARKAGTRILAITERAHAPARPDSYASGLALLEAGVLWCADLTPEAATVKATLLHLLDPDGTQFEDLWEKPLSDETGSPV